MNILIIGSESNLKEVQAKFGEENKYFLEHDHASAEDTLGKYQVVFDFIVDEDPLCFSIYNEPSQIIFINTSKVSLAELVALNGAEIKSKIFGFNGLPTFLNNEILEVSSLSTDDENEAERACNSLGTKYLLVEDRVGLVTPRVICMIINEAYYTVQEGTASKEDIDKAMKLGTNYPYGPFEWAARIGLNNIYEVLEAVYNDTKDERYKIAPLLKREFLLNGN